MRYRVVWSRQASNELARWWVMSNDRSFAYKAKEAVGLILQDDAHLQGAGLSEGLSCLDHGPLRFYYQVDVKNKVVEIESVARFRDQPF